ncbi:hypothetical protein PPL_10459 [Heterostelium album PN500]|uniref:Uncharacterized protein n=1 Tax=Heterostelium pallidum (strain ATCC 26659 / Pp 5 / PN500) TaxID=670386 RepID=D3BR55_HETP5|nr:hypothetical protein PPL_10459 [Heterostelium album PN500]EFA75887.1 hypothetical protein PPL_10459 [Heterostelium album PN500]|eukprot:XP_020428021.1 hypothetical protein PPL_10459 [Heterostelium album PN500]
MELQQLQPLLLLDELRQHQLASVERQKSLVGGGTTEFDCYLAEEEEYYVKKAKELRVMCASFVQHQRTFVGAIDFNPEFDTQYAMALAQEISQGITIIRTFVDCIRQLVFHAEFVVSYNLLHKCVDLENLSRHLAILLKEIESFQQSGVGCPAAVLVYSRQPFPGILKRYKQIPADEMIVEMLTTSQFPYTYGKLKIHHLNNQSTQYHHNHSLIPNNNSNSNINSSSSSSNNINSSNSSSSINSSSCSNSIKHNNNNNNKNNLFEQQTFDIQLEGSRYLAKVPIKLMHGTTQFSSLGFSLNLIHKSTKHQVLIETEPSDKFIAFVNDSQWVQYFSLLLKEEIYLLDKEQYVYEKVSHSRIINILQKYFHLCLKIYKRMTSHHRPLPIEPLKSMLNKISDKLTIEQFDKFMSVLSPSLKVIKYQRHAKDLWNQGLIFYYIEKEEFSLDHAYCWMIKYFSGGEIKEIIVDMKTDLTGDRQTKSIINYIDSNLQDFTEICQFDYRNNTISFVNKDEILTLPAITTT